MESLARPEGLFAAQTLNPGSLRLCSRKNYFGIIGAPGGIVCSLRCADVMTTFIFGTIYGKKYMVFHGAPGGIRTPDLRIRSPTLYPAELRAQAMKSFMASAKYHYLCFRSTAYSIHNIIIKSSTLISIQNMLATPGLSHQHCQPEIF